MEAPKAKVTIRGRGRVTTGGTWKCVRCARDFPYPQVPNSCETALSLCVWCYAEDAVEFQEDPDAGPAEAI